MLPRFALTASPQKHCLNGVSHPAFSGVSMRFSKIIGTGSYLPEKILTNADLEKIVDTTDEWIRDRTGIEQRHMAAPDQTTGDLAFIAATRALEAAGVAGKDIDLIIIGTTTPDLIFPSTATLVQHRLGANGCGAMDVNAACSGFMYALSIADNFIRAGSAKRALVIGAETLTRMLNWADRTTCVLFADGAGAVVLEASDEPGVLSTHIHADGAYTNALFNPVGVVACLMQQRGCRAAQVVRAELFQFHALFLRKPVGQRQHLIQRGTAHGLVRVIARWQDVARAAGKGFQRHENIHHLTRQVHPVRVAPLHTRLWDCPGRIHKIHFIPCCIGQF